MLIELTEEQQALRSKVRTSLEGILSPELRAELDVSGGGEGGGPEFRKAMRQLGEEGWIAMGWPQQYGGGGATPLEQYIFTEEILSSGFPYPFLTTDAVGPVLAQHAPPELQESLVQPILRGELIFAIGYSEPEAGTDLAALKTRAVKDGDHWVINGQKIWTSLANYADYVWLAARTDPDSPRHKGLSIFVVSTSDPGFSLSPIHTMGDIRTNATYYQDVRVPASALIGGVNNGWKLITGQLNRERLSLANHGMLSALYRNTCQWAAEQEAPEGGRVIERPWVQANLARAKLGLDTLELICWKQAWTMTEGELNMADASVAKVYSSELFVEGYRLLLEVMGSTGLLKKGSPGNILQGQLEMRYRTGSVLTFGGGANEVQRDIIAMVGLSMPRGR